MPHDKDELAVRSVNNRTLLNEFIHLPGILYRDDPNWVSPLYFEQKERFSNKNPFFQHARWQAWIAWRGDRPVGRISAQIDDLHLQKFQDQTGHFGCLEAVDDQEVFDALFASAESWLKSEGMVRATGPFNLSINEECGLQIDGFDTPPRIMMVHGRPYYGQAVETVGYRKGVDLIAYRQPPDFTVPKVMQRLVGRVAERVHIRPLNRKRLKSELALLRDIFNDAWSENWGMVPFTEAEFDEVGKVMSLLIDDNFVQIAEVDGEAAAMIICLPNINEAIQDLHGRLLPFGWLKLLWRLKVRYPKTARIPLMGVRKKYHHTPFGPALSFMITDTLRYPVLARGIREMEMSWILEHNSGMRNIIESLGGQACQTFRLYEKAL
ncbi:MAG: protein YghO [Gammaproteobacteria bacterium]|nr:MAG: protein YghO [Gammaproteobacteria bacterium]